MVLGADQVGEGVALGIDRALLKRRVDLAPCDRCRMGQAEAQLRTVAVGNVTRSFGV